MAYEKTVNDLVIRFANVNGTGSASANDLFAKSIFRMGIPVTPKNIFPSNIQGLPTWFEVRVSEKGYLGRRAGVDLMVGVNPQSMRKDVDIVRPGGYFVYDNSKKLHDEYLREDINYIGIPMIRLAMENFDHPRQQQLFKNIIYVGALAALLDIDTEIIKKIIAETFRKKEKLIPANYLALELGEQYAREHFDCPLPIRVERRDLLGDQILIDGNTACALGAIYAGATFMAWYPITPSTSVAKAFGTYAKKFRIDPKTSKKNYAFVQAEDELAAIGMVIGATWNGARAFTATSGPGISLMSEFIGLAYFAEIPVVLINVQRGGPSTGMPTRSQQADILSSAYASHGDTKHVLLFPSSPAECFDFTATAFDLADRLQTPVIVMSDLDLGMNNHISPALQWEEKREYDRGKVLDAQQLEKVEDWGRYLDVDDDGICYRTIPGTHPTKGSYFTRGTSRDEYAKYTEDGSVYARVVDRIAKKWETAKSLVPASEVYQKKNQWSLGMLFFGTTTYSALEAKDQLASEENLELDALRVCALPFTEAVADFIRQHDVIFVIEQNRDAQFRTVIMNELNTSSEKLISVLNYDGAPITAATIIDQILQHQNSLTPA